jgi:predicted short-subunit dehydrogenase-like oxidoreductase (DUF2520 family)
MEQLKSIGFIGAGKVATHLSAACAQAGLSVLWIWSRSLASAEKLAATVNAVPYTGHVEDLPLVDLIVLSVPDHAVIDALSCFPQMQTPVAHTSGTLELEALQDITPLPAVFYPLQSFSFGRNVTLSQVPICIESHDKELRKELGLLAERLGAKAVMTKDGQRARLHVAAVFACNFSNYMYSISEKLCEDAGLDFSLLHSLMLETAAKAVAASPGQMQTGPAVRNDIATIERHLELLKNFPEFSDLYKRISRQITNQQANEKL